MNKKIVGIFICILLIATTLFPLANAINISTILKKEKKELILEQINTGKIITVDNEPGDADFMFIHDAIEVAYPGDIIEVYSGTYFEQNLIIDDDNLSFLGISHELGQGNDTGKPFIQGNGNETVLDIASCNVFLTNLRIENILSGSLFVSGLHIGAISASDQHDISVTNLYVANCTRAGIIYCDAGINILIADNEVHNCLTSGIEINAYNGNNIICANNTVTDCIGHGISSQAKHVQYLGNIVQRCLVGIYLSFNSNQITMNEVEDCNVSVCLQRALGNKITNNNFFNYSNDGIWWERYRGDNWRYGQNFWNGNYWDTWKGKGPELIYGFWIFWIGFYPIILSFPIKWLDFDWHPAKEPYDIGLNI